MVGSLGDTQILTKTYLANDTIAIIRISGRCTFIWPKPHRVEEIQQNRSPGH